jgi:hypothetical protein
MRWGLIEVMLPDDVVPFPYEATKIFVHSAATGFVLRPSYEPGTWGPASTNEVP